jgi:tetratricopeptide (TPR) repeat protein
MPGALPDGEPVPADGKLPDSAYQGLGERPFGIYVHVPFCTTRCGYCDFNTYTAAELGGRVHQEQAGSAAVSLGSYPERLALAEAAIESAFRLRPDAGEAHLARAAHLYRGYRDYGGALAELETARQTLPNDARLFELKGYVERRRPGGDQEEALRNLERAIDLDPRNAFILQQASVSYEISPLCRRRGRTGPRARDRARQRRNESREGGGGI